MDESRKKHEDRHKREQIVWFHSNEVQQQIKSTSDSRDQNNGGPQEGSNGWKASWNFLV